MLIAASDFHDLVALNEVGLFAGSKAKQEEPIYSDIFCNESLT